MVVGRRAGGTSVTGNVRAECGEDGESASSA